ncbi:hypothetical protein [Nocardioides sp.]|uniref:hypothetical protein n=1 Tax=Nocardioides sp. TaxID=35761 RepID=UPI002732B122|nr:hypothetical protein [Nocardioides sp.]MDP3890496.1 hypothetical protein [Nocardioides sp.]
MTASSSRARGGGAAQRPQDLFTTHPATSHDRLIVRYPDNVTSVVYCFAEAAERLADSHRGQAPDDTILLPFLYLYRHAFELNLKRCIETAAATRVLGGDADPALEATEVRRRLQHDHGHRIMALFEELDSHLVALGLEAMPAKSRKLHTLLSNTDPRGESFRYPSSLPGDLGASQDYIDFIALRKTLKDGFGLAQGALSMLEAAYETTSETYAEMTYDAREEERAIEAACEADMRREHEPDMRAEFENYY